MAISKITLNGVTQIDLTSDTVTAQTLVDDYVAHGADGNTVTGELVLPTARTASDVTVLGATVTVPAGAYATQVQKSVATGTAGTPTASKGSVVNNSISVTPSVTNVTGYITGGTKSGTAVTVTAQEIVAGNTLYCDDSGNWNVANTETFVVQAGTAGTPSATKGTVSNHSISVTPSVTNSEGWISSGTKTGTAVTVTASELASGDKSITQNGSDIDVVGYSTVSVNVPTSPYTESDIKNMVERSTSFTSFTIPSNVTKIGQGAFYYCIYLNLSSLPSGITSIGSYAFYYCNSITWTSLPSGITSIGAYAFNYCTKLALTSLPSGLTSIGDHVFSSCYKLALTSLPSGLTSIDTYAFYRCYDLALTSLPSGLTSLGTYAFAECTSLALTSLPSGLTSIPQGAFQRCTSLTLTTLPSNLTSISGNAFSDCTSLTTITCNAPLTSLYGNSFNASSSSYSMQLREAYFPYLGSTATTMSISTVFGSSTADKACHELEIVDLGYATALSTSAFANCYKLQTLILRRTSAICALNQSSAFDNTPFSGYNGLTGTVYVPNALISTYQTATNWKTLYNNGTVSFVKIEGSIYEL